uniref:V-SNARE coiled-coil homology domain-containing protein n=1 Tax=Panagrellus redivivus TaxID=6233 RepID=A0A7E4UN51_PANRE
MSETKNADVERNTPENVKRVQDQVQEVKTIMAENVVRIMERGERLDDIDSRTEALHNSAQSFQQNANRVQRHMCLKNLKWSIFLAIVVLCVIALIIVLILDGVGAFGNA